MLTPTRAKFMELWGARVGDDAARVKLRSVRYQAWAALSMFVWCPCLVAGLRLHLIPLLVVGGAALCANAVLLVLMVAKRQEAMTVAGRCLGMTIRWVGPTCWPPLSQQAYETWCRRNGLTPYAANTRKDNGGTTKAMRKDAVRG